MIQHLSAENALEIYILAKKYDIQALFEKAKEVLIEYKWLLISVSYLISEVCDISNRYITSTFILIAEIRRG
jgi:hypothetical protein